VKDTLKVGAWHVEMNFEVQQKEKAKYEIMPEEEKDGERRDDDRMRPQRDDMYL